MNWDLIVYYRYMSAELVYCTLVNIAASLYLGEKKNSRYKLAQRIHQGFLNQIMYYIFNEKFIAFLS